MSSRAAPGRPPGTQTGAPLRVLHVSPSFYPAHGYGGSITTLYGLCRAELAAGLAVRVLTSDAAGPGEPGRTAGRLPGLAGRWVDDFGVPTCYAPVVAGEDLAPQVARELPALLGWADVVHVTGVWNATSLLAVAAATRWPGLRRPCVLWPCGALLPWALGQGSRHKRRVLRLLRPLYRRLSGWHATSAEEAAALDPLGVVGPRATVAVVPNGLAVGPLPDVRRRPGHILVLGRVHPVKNLELAVAALAELRRRGVADATLTLAGPERPGDGYGDHIRLLAASSGVGQVVTFPGLVVGEAKDRLLASAEVLWLTSHAESFGNVVAEALAAGTPVVAASTTPWQLLGELGCGRLAAPTPAAFAQATLDLRQSDPVILSRRCRQVAEERFAWPAVVAALVELYRRARE